jgi:hypothetical protein
MYTGSVSSEASEGSHGDSSDGFPGYIYTARSTLHNEMGTRGAPMAVVYVPGVRIFPETPFFPFKSPFSICFVSHLPVVRQLPSPCASITMSHTKMTLLHYISIFDLM